jgi:hypothetical protein
MIITHSSSEVQGHPLLEDVQYTIRIATRIPPTPLPPETTK